jgi:hypothetical protein
VPGGDDNGATYYLNATGHWTVPAGGGTGTYGNWDFEVDDTGSIGIYTAGSALAYNKLILSGGTNVSLITSSVHDDVTGGDAYRVIINSAGGGTIQNLGWVPGSGSITISDGGQSISIGNFSVAGTDYGFVYGSNGVDNTHFLNAQGGWSVPAGSGSGTMSSWTLKHWNDAINPGENILDGDIVTFKGLYGITVLRSVKTITIDHYQSDGYYHIPAGGEAGKILGWGGTLGTATWIDSGGSGTGTMSSWELQSFTGSTVEGSISVVDGSVVTFKGDADWEGPNGPIEVTRFAAGRTIQINHLSNNGFKHIPLDGETGKILGWSADGTAAWIDGGGVGLWEDSGLGYVNLITDNNARLVGGKSLEFGSDTNWKIGKDIIAVNNAILSSNTLQFVAGNNTTRGFQFVSSSNDILIEIASAINTAASGIPDVSITGSLKIGDHSTDGDVAQVINVVYGTDSIAPTNNITEGALYIQYIN